MLSAIGLSMAIAVPAFRNRTRVGRTRKTIDFDPDQEEQPLNDAGAAGRSP